MKVNTNEDQSNTHRSFPRCETRKISTAMMDEIRLLRTGSLYTNKSYRFFLFTCVMDVSVRTDDIIISYIHGFETLHPAPRLIEKCMSNTRERIHRHTNIVP